jgi:hypothetical protein
MPPPTPARRPGLSPAALAGAGLAVVVVAVGLVSLRGPGAKPEIQATASVTPPPPPAGSPAASLAAAAGGTLVVDALPWGEVVSITDSRGAKQGLANGSRYTPIAVRLPPGEYTVEVRNPAFPRSVTLQASVATGKVETRVAEFRRVDAAAYFRRVGLQP